MREKVYPTEICMYLLFAVTFFYMAGRLIGIFG